MLKECLLPAACALLLAAPGLAEPLDLATVAPDSKWLIHLDLDELRKTKVGTHFLKNFVEPKIKYSEKMQKMNFSISTENISSISAYGPAFEKDGDGVMLIRTTADVKKDLDTLAGLSSLSGGQIFSLTHLKPFPLYSFKSNLFVANIENTLVVAKSKEQIENARQLLLGKSDSLAQSQSFAGYPETSNTFFFLGMAEGFNENANIPPQAQVLKEARGGRLAMGENGDHLFVNLVFKGKSEESALKIQQVFQGIVALVSLSQENKDLTELAQAARIASEDNNVTINLQFPVQKAIQRLDQEID